MRHGWFRVSLFVFMWLMLATHARADDAHPTTAPSLTWNPSWPTFRPVEYIATGLAGAAAASIFLLMKPPSQPHWTGGILFDDAARDAFRIGSQSGRDTARRISDFTAAGAVVLTLGVDSLLIPLMRKSDKVAVQLTMMNLEAFAFSTLITNSLFTGVGRARPSYEECQRDPTSDRLCSSGATASFPSGHANGAFTAAGLSCAHHGRLPLWGGGLPDAMACIGSLSLAVTTASLRVAGDRHYVTDVLTSAGIGFGFGYGVPTLLHYAAGGSVMETKVGSAKFSLMPMGGDRYGVMAVGSF
ncbi:phosphatase PAP2 family protein [Pendulispora rubella]|uniref:Phosphatase PAP2 family protein n=1 Tax=Pendulispora rubella TaxID=2741070 RepID=A0ABZ2KY69_9BACT